MALAICLGEGSHMERVRIEQHSVGGLLWVGGWLFTVGFLHLTFGKGALAILLWPYYLGLALSTLKT